MSALTAMSTRGKIVLAASGLAILFVAFMLFRVASSPSYTTLQAGIDPAKTGKITAALDSAGVSYKLQNNGTAVAVVSGQESKARVALAGQGLASGTSQPGYELLDKQKLGASTFQQQVAYQRALEGQIAQTVGQIDGISSAQVQLTLPKDDLFASEKQPATAAVLLSADSAALDPSAVRGIASLVSSSVPDLKPSNVTITDASGTMLWPQGDGTDSATGAASKPAAEARYASGMQATLGALIARTVGSDKAQVQVHADLNVDKATEEQLTYAKKGTPLEANKETETLKGTGGSGSTAGTAANLPTYAQGAASGGGNSNYKRSTDKTTYGVDKKVTKRDIAPGAVNKLDVALLVDKSVPAAQATALKNAVAAAAGINAKRGDTINLSTIAFTKPKAAPNPAGLPVPPAFMAPLKYAGIGLASILFLFFVTRALRRREQEAIPMPTWLSEIEGPKPLAELERSTSAVPAAIAAESAGGSQVDSLVREQPERVAQQLRAWISEDTP
jgi:flagellar M-ring protein FliF